LAKPTKEYHNEARPLILLSSTDFKVWILFS
jgi:hypothetical protein